MSATATGQQWGLRIRVDTKALQGLTDGATKIANLVAQLNELKESAHGAMGAIATEVNKVNAESTSSVARLRKEIEAIKVQLNGLKSSGAGSGGSDRNYIPPRGSAATNKFLMQRYGVSEAYVETHRQNPKEGGVRNTISGSMPTPRQAGGMRYYDNNQVMAVLLYDKVARPITSALQELRSEMTQHRATTGGDSQLDRAAFDAMGTGMKLLNESMVKLTTVIAEETASRARAAVNGGTTNTPPPSMEAGSSQRNAFTKKESFTSFVATSGAKGYASRRNIDRPDLDLSKAYDQIAEMIPEFKAWSNQMAGTQFDNENALKYKMAASHAASKMQRKLDLAKKQGAGPKKLDDIQSQYNTDMKGLETSASGERTSFVDARTLSYTVARIALESQIRGLTSSSKGKNPKGDRTGANGPLRNASIQQMLAAEFGAEVNPSDVPGLLRRVAPHFETVRGLAMTQGAPGTPKVARPNPPSKTSTAAPAVAGDDEFLKALAALQSRHTEDEMEILAKVAKGNHKKYREIVMGAYERMVNPRGSSLESSLPGRGTGGQGTGDGMFSGVGSRFARAIPRVLAYGGASTLAYGGMSMMTNAVKSMAEFEHEMLAIQKVVNPTTTDVNALGAAALNMGKKFGSSITEVSRAMQTFAAVSYKQQDIISNTRTALMSANITDMDAAKSSEALISTQRQFKLSPGKSMSILNAWNTLQNRTGVGAGSIAGAIEAGGSMAYQAGMSHEQYAATAASIAASTRRSGSEVGSDLKFIMGNSHNPKAVEALEANAGVFSLDKDNKFKTFPAIMADLASKWKNLTDANKENIAVSMGGVPRMQSFYAMIESQGEIIKNTTAEQNDANSAMAANAIMQRSLIKHVDQLKSSWNGLWAELGKSGGLDVLKNLTDGLKNLVDVITTISRASSGLGGMAGALGVIAMVAGPLMTMGGTMGMGMMGGGGFANVLTTRNPGAGAGSAGGMAAMMPGAAGAAWYNKRYVQLGAAALGLNTLKGGYDHYLRGQASNGANAFMDTGVGAANTAITGAGIVRMLGGVRKTGGKAAAAAVVLLIASEVYSGITNYLNRKKDDAAAKEAVAKKAQEDSEKAAGINHDGSAILDPARISTIISQYSIAVEKLIRKNDEILQSQSFVGDNLARLKDIEGKGSAASGSGVARMSAVYKGYDIIRNNGLGEIPEPVGTNGPANQVLRYRELLGNVLAATNSGKTMSLNTLVSGSFAASRLSGNGASAEARKAFDVMVKNGGMAGDKDKPDFEANNAAGLALKSAMNNDTEFGLLEQRAATIKGLRDSKSPGAQAEADRLIQSSYGIAEGSIKGGGRNLQSAYQQGSIKALTDHREALAAGVGEMGSQYAYQYRSGQVGSVGQFSQQADVQKMISGMSRMVADEESSAATAKAAYENLLKTPPAERTQDFNRQVEDAAKIVDMFSTSAQAGRHALDNLGRSIGQFDIGMEKITDRVALDINRIHQEADAKGLTGQPAAAYMAQQFSAQQAKYNQEFKDNPDAGLAATNQIAAAQRSAQETANNTKQLYEVEKKNAQAAYLGYRLEAGAGLMPGRGNNGARDAILAEWHSFVTSYATANADKLKGADEGTIQKFIRNFQQSTGSYGQKMKELELTGNTEFNKNYLMAGPSQRALVDQIRASMSQGQSAESIFADPYLRNAAKDNPMLNDLMGQAVNADSQRMVSELSKSNQTLDQIAANTSRGMANAGYNVPAGPVSSHRDGTLSKAGSATVDSAGRIRDDGTIAQLHQGEIVLNRAQSAAFLKNKFASGTLPASFNDLNYGLDNFHGLHNAWWDQAAGKGSGRHVTNLLKLPADQKAALLQKAMAQMEHDDLLGIGGSSNRSLLASMNIEVAKARTSGSQASYDNAVTMLSKDMEGQPSWLRLKPANVRLQKIVQDGSLGYEGLVGRTAGNLAHESTHHLNKIWRMSPGLNSGHIANDRKFRDLITSLIMDDSIPGMAESRGVVGHSYKTLLNSSSGNYLHSKNYGDFQDEVLAHLVENNRSPEVKRLISAVYDPMSSAHFAMEDKYKSNGYLGALDASKLADQARTQAGANVEKLKYEWITERKANPKDILKKVTSQVIKAEVAKGAFIGPPRASMSWRAKAWAQRAGMRTGELMGNARKSTGGLLRDWRNWDTRFDNMINNGVDRLENLGQRITPSKLRYSDGPEAYAQHLYQSQQAAEIDSTLHAMIGRDSAVADMGRFVGKGVWNRVAGPGTLNGEIGPVIGRGISKLSRRAWNQGSGVAGDVWGVLGGPESAAHDLTKFVGQEAWRLGKTKINIPGVDTDAIAGRIARSRLGRGVASGIDRLEGLGQRLTPAGYRHGTPGFGPPAPSPEQIKAMRRAQRQAESAAWEKWKLERNVQMKGPSSSAPVGSVEVGGEHRFEVTSDAEWVARNSGQAVRAAEAASGKGVRNWFKGLAPEGMPKLDLHLGGYGGKLLHAGGLAGMLAQGFGIDQTLADKMGVGGGYSHVRPFVSLGVERAGMWGGMARTGSFSGFGLHEMLANRIGGSLEGMALKGAGSWPSVFNGSARGVRGLSRGATMAGKITGNLAELQMAAEAGSRIAGLGYAGLNRYAPGAFGGNMLGNYKDIKEASEGTTESISGWWDTALGTTGLDAKWLHPSNLFKTHDEIDADFERNQRIAKYYRNNMNHQMNLHSSVGSYMGAVFGRRDARLEVEQEDRDIANSARMSADRQARYQSLGDRVAHPLVFRDGGGVFRDRADILVGKNRNEMVVAPERTSQLFEGLDSLKKMKNVVGREDLMRSDAQGFSSLQPTTSSGHTNISHAGAVTLGLGEGVEDVITKLAETIHKGSKGAGVRVGDKVYGPLIG